MAAVTDYLCARGMASGPPFQYDDGHPLTRQRFATAERSASGLDPSRYGTHSFRIGAATTAAARGIEDAVIKPLGRWGSLAYLHYVQIPQQQLASVSSRIGV